MEKFSLNILSILPKAPPLHEDPIGGIEVGKEVCEICGKTLRTHAELDRQLENVHGIQKKLIPNHIFNS